MKILTFIGSVLVLVLLVALSTFTVVDAGHRAVITRFGEVQENILGEGFHFISPFDRVHEFEIRTQTINFEGDSSLGAASKDLQDVRISFVTNFHPDPEQIGVIYQTFGEDYQTNILKPIIRETVKAVSAQFTAEELVTKRAEVSMRIETDISKRFAEKNMILESGRIVNFVFSDSFNDAIENKVRAEQDALASKNKLEQTKYEAEQQIVTAKAQAESIRIQAEAVTQQGGKDYVQLQAIQKWNGQLPNQFVPGSALPFINLNQ